MGMDIFIKKIHLFIYLFCLLQPGSIQTHSNLLVVFFRSWIAILAKLEVNLTFSLFFPHVYFKNFLSWWLAFYVQLLLCPWKKLASLNTLLFCLSLLFLKEKYSLLDVFYFSSSADATWVATFMKMLVQHTSKQAVVFPLYHKFPEVYPDWPLTVESCRWKCLKDELCGIALPIVLLPLTLWANAAGQNVCTVHFWLQDKSKGNQFYPR